MTARTVWYLTIFALLFSDALLLAEDDSGVHVAGTGVVRVAPDQVVIDLTVTTIDDDLIRVRETSDKEAQTILAFVKKHDIASSGFNVTRLDLSLDFNKQLKRQIYEVERDVTLTLDDLTKLDPILSDLLKVSNLQIGGITFGVSNTRKYKLDALKVAVADAREKANLLATLNGLKLGSARNINVTYENQQPFVTSVEPAVGLFNIKDSNRVRHQKARTAIVGKGKRGLVSKPIAKAEPSPKNKTKSVHLVTVKMQDDQPQKGKFALGLIEISANVQISFDLKE